WYGPAREDIEQPAIPRLNCIVRLALAEKDRTKAGRRIYPEVIANTGPTQVCVDQKDPVALKAERSGQITHQGRLALPGHRARHEQASTAATWPGGTKVHP